MPNRMQKDVARLILIVCLLFLLCLLAVRCVARKSTGELNLHASMTQTVLIAETTYEQIMVGLGESYRRGDISRETLERGRLLGKETYQAIDTAKVVLRTYLREGQFANTSSARLYHALATMSALMVKLEEFYTEELGSVAKLE